jgi:beta-lactamase regulating signal transducer with metallopeptidase domain
MVLGHELAHVERGDLLWRVVATVVRATFFFNPLMWLSHWRLGLSQEIAADELAIAQQKHDPASYGSLLVSVVGKFGPARVLPRASVETAGSMKTLKRRLVAMKFFSEASRRIVGTSLILLAMVAVLGLVPWRLVAVEQQQGKPSVRRAPVVSKTLKSTVSSLGSVALAPNGKMLASVDTDLVWAVKLWDVATGRNMATLRNHDERE